MKARKKPVEIECIQLKEDGSNIQECYDFVGAKGNFPECGMGIDPLDGQFKITTLEGVMVASLSDYIIKGLKGEFYPCKKEIFEMSYDICEETSFLDRLIKEEKELGEKVIALSTALSKDHFNKVVGNLQYSYLNVQRSAMIAYRQILVIRIEDLKSKEETK